MNSCSLQISKKEYYDSIEENSTIQLDKTLMLHSDFGKKLKWAILVIVLIILAIVIIERKNKKTIKSLKSRIESLQTLKSSSETD